MRRAEIKRVIHLIDDESNATFGKRRSEPRHFRRCHDGAGGIVRSIDEHQARLSSTAANTALPSGRNCSAAQARTL